MRTEQQLLEWISGLDSTPADGLKMGIGDDCAVFRPGDESVVITCDLLTEGVHFRRSSISPRFLGRKSLRVNVSDVAAMGARPYICLLSLSLPGELTEDYLEEFLQGFLEETKRWNCPLVGGDLSGDQRLHVSVTLLGRVPAGKEVYRSGAQPGDFVLSVGNLGYSRKGLEMLSRAEDETFSEVTSEAQVAHRTGSRDAADFLRAHWLPEPQVEVGVWLRENGLVNAMIDVSDGLATDLLRLARASGMGAVLDLELLRSGYIQGSPIGEMDYILNGGEDYALLFAAGADQLTRLRETYPQRLPPFRVVGRMLEGTPRLWLQDGEERREYQPRGYDHFR